MKTKDFLENKGDILSLDKVMDLFYSIADDRSMAFDYLKGGCYARAHMICRQLESLGLEAKKAWAIPNIMHQDSDFFEGMPELFLTALSADGVKYGWSYHVSAAVNVLSSEGSVDELIIDPGLFDAPVKLDQWKNTMLPKAKFVEIVPFGESPSICYGDYTMSKNTSYRSDKNAQEVMNDIVASSFNSASRVVYRSDIIDTLKKEGIAVKESGKNWVTKINP